MRAFFKICCYLLVMVSLVLLTPRAAHADGGAPNLAYVAGTSHGISVIDVAQQKVTSTLAADGDPHTILLSLDARFLYVTEPTLNRVAILAAKSGQTVCTANVPGQPSLLALDPGTNILYAAGNGATSVSAIDTTDCTIKQTLKTAGNVYGLAVAVVGGGPSGGNGNQIWVSDTTSVTIFDSAGKQLTSIPVNGGPQYITIPTGFVAYVTTRSGTVDAIDLNTRSVLPPLIKGQAFGPMDYDALTGEVYVPDIDGNQIDVLAPVLPDSPNPQHQPSRVINFGVAPQSIAITSDGQLGFVALSGGNVAMLDIPGRQVVSTIFVGGNPHFIITGLYPPLIGSTPQEASIWGTIINIASYVLVVALLIVPMLIIWRKRAKT